MKQASSMQTGLRTLTAALVVSVLFLQPMNARAQGQPDLSQIQQMQVFLKLMGSYLGVINSLHEINDDPARAAILKMHKIQEVYEERGEKAKVVDILRSVLDSSKNPTIRSAAYLMIGDALKSTGRSDEAIRVLREGLTESLNVAERAP